MVDFKKAAADGRRAILIPSRGRPRTLKRLFTKQPFLNRSSTFLGIEERERELYAPVLDTVANLCRVVYYHNDEGITGVAREALRQAWLRTPGQWDTVLPLDDNMFYSHESLDNLVACSRELNEGRTQDWSIVSGEHPTAAHFQEDRIKLAWTTDRGYKVFPHTTVIYWAIPASLYRQFQYPHDCCFDDVYLAFWLLSVKKVTNWVVCRNAPFDKKRYEAGGQGNAAQRSLKVGRGISRLALDFPQWMSNGIIQTRFPYARILEALRSGKTNF